MNDERKLDIWFTSKPFTIIKGISLGYLQLLSQISFRAYLVASNEPTCEHMDSIGPIGADAPSPPKLRVSVLFMKVTTFVILQSRI
jgi:hypothetical protein